MLLWTLTYAVMGWGFLELKPLRERLIQWMRRDRILEELRRSASRIRLLQEMLESGINPESKDWERIQEFPAPWNRIVGQSLRDLRNDGAPVLPTLERVHRTLLDQVEFILESKVKSAQALSQAHLSLALIPGFASVLYGFLPGIRESGMAFSLLAIFSTLLSSVAYFWILWMADQARYGDVRSEHRSWWVSIQATLERVFALISSGRPPDLAWRAAIEELLKIDPGLARHWGGNVWDSIAPVSSSDHSECERMMILLGLEIRRSIQISLIEGRGCLDRLESIHRSCFSELKSKVQSELNLLPNRCLKPLFIFVLPGVMLLLCGSLWLSLGEWGL